MVLVNAEKPQLFGCGIQIDFGVLLSVFGLFKSTLGDGTLFVKSLRSFELKPPATSGFSATGLRVNSVLRLHRLITVSTKIIQRELGRLSSNLEHEAAEKLSLLFSLKS